jgi:ABC-type lipoprotein export system ATPase subunit
MPDTLDYFRKYLVLMILNKDCLNSFTTAYFFKSENSFATSTMSKHIIQAINFHLSNSESPFISNLNWTVDESEWIEIVGINNSGKTTLLDALYGHIQRSTGQLFVLGFSMTPVAKDDLSSLRRKIGYAKQETNLLRNKTLRANLAMALNAADRILDQNVDEIIMNLANSFSLKEVLLKEIKHLSFSQLHMAAIARALIHKPKLLIIDQSFDFLDSANRTKVIELIQEHRETERMAVISTSVYGWHSAIVNCKAMRLADGKLELQIL